MPKTLEFDFRGHKATLICPDSPEDGNPWLWRTEFLYAFNDADMALLNRGRHIAYCQYSDEYGSGRAVELFKEFRDFLVKEYKLSPKASLFGFSRGALYAINYSVKYPGDVSSLYLDAPVIDLRSWPGGFWKGHGSPDEWADCKKRVLGIESDEEADNIEINPINYLDKLAETDIPALIIAGDSDAYVPFEENGKYLYDAYKSLNKTVQLIIKPGCDHHPHSLENVEPIVRFVEKYGK